MTTMGYLISTHKNPASSPAIIFTDEEADGVSRDGGRGKSFLMRAPEKLRNLTYRGGDDFRPEYIHKFDGMDASHDLIMLDDVPKNFNFDSLYTQISGDIKVEPKGKKAFTISFKDAFKFVISTNYPLPFNKNAASTNRRYTENKISNFWNEKNSPVDYFGKIFFDEWGDKNCNQWQLFYEFMIRCEIKFLQKGLIKQAYSKDYDNFRHSFSCDAKLEEFERIFATMKAKGSFTVTQFLYEYSISPLKSLKLFNHIKLKREINTYIEYHELNVQYREKDKLWTFNSVTVVPQQCLKIDFPS